MSYWRIFLVALLVTLCVTAVTAETVEADLYCHDLDDAVAYAADPDNPPSSCGSFVDEWNRTAVGEAEFIAEILNTPYSVYGLDFQNGTGAFVLLPSDI